MPETETFTEEEVSQYLDDPIVTDDHSLGTMETCIRVIGKYEEGDPRRSLTMVKAACDNIAEWADDYGVVMDFRVN